MNLPPHSTQEASPSLQVLQNFEKPSSFNVRAESESEELKNAPEQKSVDVSVQPLEVSYEHDDGLEDFVYTEAEEKAVVRKIDLILMPLLFLGFYTFQLERGNISNVLTDGFLKDVGITQDQFNTGNSLLFLGIILLEIPSNYCLQIIGPRIWISFQVLAFGLVATLQAFQSGYGSYLATRILLGVTECGYIPGSLYLISTFYRRKELAARNGIFFVGSGLATATSGLLAYGILPLGTRHPALHGWQWLMIVEGCMAIFAAVLFFLLLPGSPSIPTPLLFPRFSVFTVKERRILTARIWSEDEAQKSSSGKLKIKKDVLDTLGDWRVWPHALMAICPISTVSAIGIYAPTLIQSFEFGKLEANALSSIGGWISLITTLLFGFLSDKTNMRGISFIVAVTFYWIFWVAFQQVSTSGDKWLKFGMLTMVKGFGGAYHPLNATWLSLNCATPQKRSVAMAIFVMSANIGGLVGSQLLRGKDAPLYKTGFRVCVALVSFGLLVGILQHLQYRYSNRKAERQRDDLEESKFDRGLRRFTM